MKTRNNAGENKGRLETEQKCKGCEMGRGRKLKEKV